MRLFDILGPIMVGPSSSHTAGAVKMGYVAQKLLGDVPARAEITLYGSFAQTGRGHGTDRALVAGLLGMQPDDLRIPNSFSLAQKAGRKFFRATESKIRSAVFWERKSGCLFGAKSLLQAEFLKNPGHCGFL